MKKKVLLLFVLTLLFSGALFAQIKSGSSAWVSSKTVDLKSSTGFFASTVGKLALGDEVSVLQISGSKAEVRSVTNSNLRGWTATSNLSARRIVASGTGASASESPLRGRDSARKWKIPTRPRVSLTTRT